MMLIGGIAIDVDIIISGKLPSLPFFWLPQIFAIIPRLIFVTMVAEIFYATPAFLMALVVTLGKTRKTPWGILFIFVLGGLAATLWNVFLLPFYNKEANFQAIIDEFIRDTLFSAHINIFYWGAITSSIMAMRVLPKKSQT